MVGATLVHGDAEFGEELADPAVDVVDDAAHGVGVLAFRVVNGPVFVALAREGRARLATSHRDDHVGGFDHIRVELGRLLGGGRQAPVGEHVGDDGVDRVLRL